ncbi:MAG TPA: hypothetical protein VFI25_00560 [Planctomycetota bacterium]|jgi:hypothetical protein|nr:hypothetical protein [Planctomycetota bacterium]
MRPSGESESAAPAPGPAGPSSGGFLRSSARHLRRAARWAALGSLAGLAIPAVFLGGFTVLRFVERHLRGAAPWDGTYVAQEVWAWTFLYGVGWLFTLPASLLFWASLGVGIRPLLERWRGRGRRIAFVTTTLVALAIECAYTILYLKAHPMC